MYPHDLDIHCCIGCYQCYNTGTCVFDDDMSGIIDAIRGASLLVVCSPVYTNTVPGGLKLLIDRTQAYHAERVLFGGRTGQSGLVLRFRAQGGDNFTCVPGSLPHSLKTSVSDLQGRSWSTVLTQSGISGPAKASNSRQKNWYASACANGYSDTPAPGNLNIRAARAVTIKKFPNGWCTATL